jgi:hypothetical protein
MRQQTWQFHATAATGNQEVHRKSPFFVGHSHARKNRLFALRSNIPGPKVIHYLHAKGHFVSSIQEQGHRFPRSDILVAKIKKTKQRQLRDPGPRATAACRRT